MNCVPICVQRDLRVHGSCVLIAFVGLLFVGAGCVAPAAPPDVEVCICAVPLHPVGMVEGLDRHMNGYRFRGCWRPAGADENTAGVVELGQLALGWVSAHFGCLQSGVELRCVDMADRDYGSGVVWVVMRAYWHGVATPMVSRFKVERGCVVEAIVDMARFDVMRMAPGIGVGGADRLARSYVEEAFRSGDIDREERVSLLRNVKPVEVWLPFVPESGQYDCEGVLLELGRQLFDGFPLVMSATTGRIWRDD